MAAEKKLRSPVTLFAAVEQKQHAVLRELAFKDKRSIADLVREALAEYIAIRTKKRKMARRTSNDEGEAEG